MSRLQIQEFEPAGNLIHEIDSKNERLAKATGVRHLGDLIWLGSFEQSTIAALDVPRAAPPVD